MHEKCMDTDWLMINYYNINVIISFLLKFKKKILDELKCVLKLKYTKKKNRLCVCIFLGLLIFHFQFWERKCVWFFVLLVVNINLKYSFFSFSSNDSIQYNRKQWKKKRKNVFKVHIYNLYDATFRWVWKKIYIFFYFL